MKRGFGIGLLLLASALLLVTIGVTLNVQGSMNSLLATEFLLVILISVGIFGLLLADRRWNVAHLIVLIIAIFGFVFGIKGFFVATSSIELLALISLDLLGFVLAIFMVTAQTKPLERKQKTLETFDTPTSVVYETLTTPKNVVKKKTTKKKTAKKAKKKTAKKKTAKKVTKKTVKATPKKEIATKKKSETHF